MSRRVRLGYEVLDVFFNKFFNSVELGKTSFRCCCGKRERHGGFLNDTAARK